MQKEITTKQPLLDSEGNLASPGWCRRNLFIYNRDNINADKFRLKEWDFYQISNGHQMVQINFFNISYASCATFGFVDLHTGRKFDTMFLKPLTPNRHRLNHNGDNDNYIKFTSKDKALIFNVKDGIYHLHYKSKIKGKDLIADFECHKLKNHESITIATPFKEKHHFFYTNKINCLQTEGKVIFGKEQFDFSYDNTYTVLDWGRGVWPHKNMWYWANGSAKIDGKLFGFELTWGFGDTTNAEETAVFYDGKCHKLGSVHLEKDPEINNKWMEPWHFVSDDGRLDMIMTPFYDHYSDMMPLNLIGMRSHQVHGLFNGYAVLDDGTRIEIKDMYAFCEKVYNKW